MSVVSTYRVVREQDMGGGRVRAAGELMPEAHLWFAPEHWVHTGGLKEELDVEEAEFRAAVEKYCPELADQLYPRVGLDEHSYVESNGRASVRAAPLRPLSLPAVATDQSVAQPAKRKRRNPRVGAQRQGESTIVPSSVPPGTHRSANPR